MLMWVLVPDNPYSSGGGSSCSSQRSFLSRPWYSEGFVIFIQATIYILSQRNRIVEVQNHVWFYFLSF